MSDRWPLAVRAEGCMHKESIQMDKKIIEVRTRTATGKSAAKKLRAEGRIPAVMYDGAGKVTLLDLDEKDFFKMYHLITESTLVDIKIDGSKDVIGFLKDVQYNILTERVGHVDFYVVDPAKVLRTRIPLKLSGTPEAVRSGAVLEHGTTELEVECLPRDLPERVMVDVSGLEANHSIHVKDIQVKSGVKVLTDGNRTVATLRFAKG